MLENKVAYIIERLREASNNGKTIVLLDYDTNADVEDARKPLSYASLVKAYAEGIYPYDDDKCQSESSGGGILQNLKRQDNSVGLV